MRFFLILCLAGLLYTACDTATPAEPQKKVVHFLENKELTFKEKLERCLSAVYREELGFNEEQLEWLTQVYEKNKYAPIWFNDSILNEKGEQMKETLEHCMWLGIPETRLKFTKKEIINPVITELLMTARSALILQDLKTGMFNDTTKQYLPQRFADVTVYDSLLAFPDSIGYSRFYIDHSFTDTNYRYLAEHLYDFCSDFPIDKTTFDIKPEKEDSINAVPMAMNALQKKGYLGLADTGKVLFMNALKQFQVHNGLKPDGKIGKYTAWALNENTYDKVLRAGLALDKMRRKQKYPEKFVKVNLPEYLLRFYVNDSLKSVHNIICGTTDHQTPELKSKIHTVVVYPYWNVPYSISSKEILPAVKANHNYLSKNNYKIYKGDHEVNPHSVKWKKIPKNTFPYKVIQQPGPSNSLGIIKFEFHNDYSVYIHDTPTKYLFKTDVRSYSHGCMRCQNPVDLGKLILDYDTLRPKKRKIGGKGNPLTPDSLDSLMNLAENYEIRLKDPVPVFVEYQSVVADKEHMVFHLDIYRRDEEYLKIMRD